MDLLPKHLKGDYERTKNQFDFEVEYPDCIIKPLDVLKAHYLICDYFESTQKVLSLYGVRDINLLCSAVGRQNTCFGDASKWKEPLDKCASLFFGLVKNHAFHDGNKRTALLVALYNLTLIGRIPEGKQRDFERLTMEIASNRLSYYNHDKKLVDKDVVTISRRLKQLTRKSDKRYYAMTFKEFNQKLKQYGFYFDNPNDNYINVYTKKKTLLGTKEKFIIQVGFPGWSSQINVKAAKSILKETGLSEQMDCYAFFKGGEPIYKLIEDYQGPLSRLKDK